MTVAILYVEDDAMTREVIAGRLRRRGYDVTEATSGEEALRLAATIPQPAAALLDVDLPGINGLETYRKLLELYPRLPAVVCSAALLDGARKPFQELGVPDECLLAKPCAFDQMLAAIDIALEEGR